MEICCLIYNDLLRHDKRSCAPRWRFENGHAHIIGRFLEYPYSITDLLVIPPYNPISTTLTVKELPLTHQQTTWYHLTRRYIDLWTRTVRQWQTSTSVTHLRTLLIKHKLSLTAPSTFLTPMRRVRLPPRYLPHRIVHRVTPSAQHLWLTHHLPVLPDAQLTTVRQPHSPARQVH